MSATDRGPAAYAPAAGAAATCVFAVRRSGDPGALAGRTGHAGGGPLRLLPLAGSLWAVVQSVPAAEFTQEALRQRLADPLVLENCARSHHAVITAAAEDGPVVPLPLATLFTDERRAVDVLDQQRSHLVGVLDRLTGRAEWAVKVHIGRPAEARAPARSAPRAVGDRTGADAATGTGAGTGAGADADAGAAYLTRVRGRERDRRAWQDATLHVAQQVHDTAAALAVAAVRRTPHGPRITGPERHQVLNAAFLVDDARAEELATAVRALHGAFPGLDVHIDVSGPWVPYSFTEGRRP
ncbi:putative gas vesicle synthesis protein [Actinacidiphila reveromycinica]|uniref:Putative gas vesicle synthesis protein n=1 Tax=Actinacidiphila reveromycinica TaxID=659352 RepID=A0A7U3VLD7_9ACTN|nr:GvpL/GvpF family gas vesicle protein [Streptomyces sp. SN-593]BBA95424.1 putative gas vesicle synthesis protein [Streptomyces sp. SN-593]